MNRDIRNIIGKYLLPSIQNIKIKKKRILIDLTHNIVNIKFYLNNNLISSDGNTQYTCNNFTYKRYKRIYDGIYYWTIRDNSHCRE